MSVSLTHALPATRTSGASPLGRLATIEDPCFPPGARPRIDRARVAAGGPPWWKPEHGRREAMTLRAVHHPSASASGIARSPVDGVLMNDDRGGTDDTASTGLYTLKAEWTFPGRSDHCRQERLGRPPIPASVTPADRVLRG
ncbi:MAG: hypothetical protein M0026_04295 [Nocardiopsaceae bacterium]|nr:hypothetical protein [Nocardiopsaceae bacterium]